MKKFSVNRKDPKLFRTGDEAIVVIPPDISAAAIGMPDAKVCKLSDIAELDLPESEKNGASTKKFENDSSVPAYGEGRSRQIMGLQECSDAAMLQNTENCRTKFESMSGYLRCHAGDYVKIEFLFGEQTHMEKVGTLREIGRDFVVIREPGTENDVLCKTNTIKFITVYSAV